MAEVSTRKRIWGWFFFDWASQPYNTLLLTFIFGPYIRELIGDPEDAQATWAFAVGFAGVVMALLAPVLGAVADTSGTRMRWIWIFSALYVIGAAGIWIAAPGDFNLTLVLLLFCVGLIGMEFATIFTNSMLPDLGTDDEIGRISGNGWAFGYLGGLLALVIMPSVFRRKRRHRKNPDRTGAGFWSRPGSTGGHALCRAAYRNLVRGIHVPIFPLGAGSTPSWPGNSRRNSQGSA